MISPVKGGIVTIKYRLTSVGIVSAWVEDAKGNRVISLGEEREGSEGYFTWAGMDQNGNPVPDGLYYIN